MKLYVVRHGETVWNELHKVQGTADIPLAEKGIELAEKTGEALKEVPFDLCITSPLVRARRTAELILEKQPHKVLVIEDKRIQEINFGELEGVVCFTDEHVFLNEQMEKIFKETFQTYNQISLRFHLNTHVKVASFFLFISGNGSKYAQRFYSESLP